MESQTALVLMDTMPTKKNVQNVITHALYVKNMDHVLNVLETEFLKMASVFVQKTPMRFKKLHVQIVQMNVLLVHQMENVPHVPLTDPKPQSVIVILAILKPLSMT